MADPLSIVGGLAAVVQLGSQVARYIKAAKDATTDRLKLLSEVNATAALCQTLADFVEIDASEDSEQWKMTLETLCVPEGPIEQSRSTLKLLEKRLVVSERRPKLLQSLKWPFSKTDVMQAVADLERQKALLTLALANDGLRLSHAIHEDVRIIVRGVDSIQLQQKEQSQQIQEYADAFKVDRKRTLLSSLSPINFNSTHSAIASRRAAGTGVWLLQNPVFREWEDGHRAFLWCRGIPGSGKTILANLVIDTFRAARCFEPPAVVEKLDPVRSKLSLGVAGIYCSYKTADTLVAMLGSIISQLAETLVELPESVFSTSTKLDISGLEAAFIDIVSRYEKIVIVVDALDECANRQELVKELRKLCDIGTPCRVRMLITSRTGVADIEQELDNACPKIEIKSSEHDVRVFLRQCLSDQSQFSRWIEESAQFETDIIETILDKMTGMFLLARLYIDILTQIPSKRGVRKALASLPQGIEETYTEAWNRILGQRPHQAAIGQRVLAWVVHSARPIRISELTVALAIEEGDEEIDEEGFLDAAALTSFCAGLVIVDDESQILSLVHPTTQEYFTARRTQLLPNSHEDMALTCMTYLRMRPFSEGGSVTDGLAFQNRVFENPLLGYAVVFWGFHAREAKSERVQLESLALLTNTQVRLAAFQALSLNVSEARNVGYEWPYYCFGRDLDDAGIQAYTVPTMDVSPLHLSSFYGLKAATRIILDEGTNINERDGMGGSAVHWAIHGEQNEILELLLKAGADPNINRSPTTCRRWYMAEMGTLPLSVAAWNSDTTAMRLLLQHGAEIDRSLTAANDSSNTGSALSAALTSGNDDAACLLLGSGADPNICRKAIRHTSTHGAVKTMKKLIDRGLSQATLDEAIVASTLGGQDTKVELLLKAGADPESTLADEWEVEPVGTRTSPDSVSWPGQTLLVTSIERRREEDGAKYFRCFCLLVEAGARVNRICRRSHHFLDDYPDPASDHTTSTYPLHRITTPLIRAAYFWLLEEIRVLAGKGADLNFVSANPQLPHPLKAALDGEHIYHAGGIPGVGRRKRTSSPLVRDTLLLMVELGSDPRLCSEEDQTRIQQLLNLSPVECEYLAAFQFILNQRFDQSYRNTREQLLELIGRGADPYICCERDRQWIERVADVTHVRGVAT